MPVLQTAVSFGFRLTLNFIFHITFVLKVETQ